ncbi:MAG TPA: class I SAM-dependent methyltransferase [Rhizomicrobium sp.]|nr:class I SAM-dependent methyltransferase [Rhizomicrobium sp.]
MKFETIAKIVEGVRFISPGNARILYDLIVSERRNNILELGIAHGTATCYMAAAVDELGQGGKVTAVDLERARAEFSPSAEEQLAGAGLSHLVRIVRMKTGYNWFLHDNIRENTKDDVCAEQYDLCIIDGPKNWTIDGLAFFLVDKLLKPDGVLIFDDYDWTYSSAGRKRDQTDGVQHNDLSDAELRTPQIREVFELLVKQHPNYGQFELLPGSDWAIARKTKSDAKTYTVRYDSTSENPVKRFLRKRKARRREAALRNK